MAEGSEFIDSMTNCPICFETYEEKGDHAPLLLPCTNSLCGKCVADFTHSGQLDCSACKKKHPVDSENETFEINKYILVYIREHPPNIKEQEERKRKMEEDKRQNLLKKYENIHNDLKIKKEKMIRLKTNIGVSKNYDFEKMEEQRKKRIQEIDNYFDEMKEKIEKQAEFAEEKSDKILGDMEKISEELEKVRSEIEKSESTGPVIQEKLAQVQSKVSEPLEAIKYISFKEGTGNLKQMYGGLSYNHLTYQVNQSETFKVSVHYGGDGWIMCPAADGSTVTGTEPSETWYLNRYSWQQKKFLYKTSVGNRIRRLCPVTLAGTTCIAFTQEYTFSSKRHIQFRDINRLNKVLLKYKLHARKLFSLNSTMLVAIDENEDLIVLDCTSSPPTQKTVKNLTNSDSLTGTCLVDRGDKTLVVLSYSGKVYGMVAIDINSGEREWFSIRSSVQGVTTDGRGNIYALEKGAVSLYTTNGVYVRGIISGDTTKWVCSWEYWQALFIGIKKDSELQIMRVDGLLNEAPPAPPPPILR